MLKFSLAFYAAAIALVVLINLGSDPQTGLTGLQQLSNSELGLTQLN